MKNLISVSIMCLVLIGCAPSKQKLANMSEYELCDWIYQLQRSAQPEYQKYYWEELRNRNVNNCNQHERQIREVHAARHQNMMNIFNAMAIGASVSESRTPSNLNNNSTTNNYYVAPQPLPPVIITPPNTIPKK
jgi:hypothetical protein